MEYQAIADDPQRFTTAGIRLELRPYVNTQSEPRIIWKIGDKLGTDGVFDPKAGIILLPNGRTVSLGNDPVRVVTLPRFISDALTKEFEKLEEEVGTRLFKARAVEPANSNESSPVEENGENNEDSGFAMFRGCSDEGDTSETAEDE